MIVNLHFDKIVNNRFVYDGVISLDTNYSYQVAVRHVHIQLESNQISKDNELWCLSTNLVDRCQANPLQALSYYTFSKGKLNHEITPSPVVFFPLEEHHLENPQFLIQRISKDKLITVEHIFVQIEIRKCLE